MTAMHWMARSGLILAGLGAIVDQQLNATATYENCARMTPPVVISIGAGCAVLIGLGLLASTYAHRELKVSTSEKDRRQVSFTAELSIMACLLALLFVGVATASALIVPSCFR